MKQYFLTEDHGEIQLFGQRENKYFGNAPLLGSYIHNLDVYEEYKKYSYRLLGHYYSVPSCEELISEENLEFESNEEACLWFLMKHPGAKTIYTER